MTTSDKQTRLAKNPRYPAETLQMYADYQAGMSLEDLGAKYYYHSSGIWARFRRMGLPMRVANKDKRRAS